MNTKQIAAVANVDERTVRRWAQVASGNLPAIADKMSAASSAHPADYDLAETIAIIQAGGNATLAALLADNATGQVRSAPRVLGPLPNGAQLRELRILFEKKALTSAQVAAALGVSGAVAAPGRALALQQEPASAETVAGLERMLSDLRNKAVRQGAAAMGHALKAGTEQIVRDLSTGHLDFTGARG